MPSKGSSAIVRGVLRPVWDWDPTVELSVRGPMSRPAVDTEGEKNKQTHKFVNWGQQKLVNIRRDFCAIIPRETLTFLRVKLKDLSAKKIYFAHETQKCNQNNFHLREIASLVLLKQSRAPRWKPANHRDGHEGWSWLVRISCNQIMFQFLPWLLKTI